MRSLAMRASVPGGDATEVFARLRDMTRYPEASPAILSIEVADGCSTWHVQFREGVLVWTERDTIDVDVLELRFELVEGDFEQLEGRWRVVPVDGGCEIELETRFDFGIPSLRPLIDPLAERALYDNGVELLRGLLGEGAEVLTPRPSGGMLEELLG